MEAMAIEVKFWGVRGSTPTPTVNHIGYGGNTTCIEVRDGAGERIIFDAGSGIRELGRKIAREGKAQDLDVFLTHFHWDHIQGIPFFAPLLSEGNTVRFHSFVPEQEIQARLQRQMSDPYFTLDFKAVGAKKEFRQTLGGFRKGGLSVTAFPMNHPQGAFGYRVECEGQVVVIATDLEHGQAELDRVLREHSEGADVLIYDAQYTPEEYESRKGWGHSTYAAAVSVARDARVKELMLFHHDPAHDDMQIGQIVGSARELFENVSGASESDDLSV
jgi:phosphoribosyl 1,2-cyclic phosphodiesterase